MIDKIEIRVDPDRMNKVVSVDDYIALEDRTIKGTRNVIAYFLVDKHGTYIPHDKALRILGVLNLEQLLQLADEFIKGTEVAAGADPKVPTEFSEPTLQS